MPKTEFKSAQALFRHLKRRAERAAPQRVEPAPYQYPSLPNPVANAVAGAIGFMVPAPYLDRSLRALVANASS